MVQKFIWSFISLQRLTKKQKKQRKLHAELFGNKVDGPDPTNLNEAKSSKSITNESTTSNETYKVEDVAEFLTENPQKSEVGMSSSKARRKKKPPKNTNNPQTPSNQTHPASVSSTKNNLCDTCHKEYPTRNKLFQHLKSTGHAMIINQPGTQRRKKRN